MKCFYFGCWNEAGHYLHGPGGSSVPFEEREKVERFVVDGKEHHIDGALAPRKNREGGLCWNVQHEDVRYRSGECPQGQYLVHVLPNGYTAMQWWDRTQGDKRGACNSTILLEGERTEEELLAALREHFPTVVANLEKAGVRLRRAE